MKKQFGSEKPRQFAPSGDKKFQGGKPGFKPRKKFGEERHDAKHSSDERRASGDKPAWKSDRPTWKSDRPGGSDRPRRSEEGSERRPYGDEPTWKKDRPGFKSDRPAWKSDRPSWKSDRPGGSDRPRRSEEGSERRPYGDKPTWKKDRTDFRSDRPGWKPERPAWKSESSGGRGDRPRYDDRAERKSFDDKPAWKSGGKTGFKSERPAWKSDRPQDEETRKSYGDRPAWKSDRFQDGGARKPYGDKPAWKHEKPSYKAERPAWKPEDQEKSSRGSVTVPYNKKNKDEATDVAPPARREYTEKFSRPAYNRQTDAKTLIVTLEDTHNVPVRLVWIYDSMVGELPDGEPAPGETVYVYDTNNRFVGSAIYNPHSRIRARIFCLTRRKFDQDYLRESIDKAVATRRQLGLAKESFRAVFGEGDGIPGLIADKIGDYLVIQPLTYAVNRHLSFIVDHLNGLLAPEGIVVRTDVPIRVKEGLQVEPPAVHGEVPERVEVREEGTIQFAYPAGGQKTGLFLDQRLNRSAMEPFCKGARVLDLFCHVGGWAIRAAKYGASEVIGVDSSESALELAKAGATASGFSNVSFVEDDVFEYLRKLDNDPESQFDVIVCDPPAFAKTRSHYEEAFRAYLSLNYLVMKKLKPGGVLITCSCSQAVSVVEFNEAILTAARNARMQFQILERRGAPQDHPVLLGLPESEYLKCFVLRRTE